MSTTLKLAIAIICLAFAGAASSQPAPSSADYQRNFESCRGGVEASCYRSLLTPADLAKVLIADRERNEVACRYGYATCRRDDLSPETRGTLDDAAYKANYFGCRFSSAPCKPDLLNSEDRQEIDALFYGRNLTACQARHVSCRPEKLNQQHRAELPLAGFPLLIGQAPPVVLPPVVAPPSCADRGGCYGETSALTGRPKTVQVRGYYRKDGTYVRPHHRSRAK